MNFLKLLSAFDSWERFNPMTANERSFWFALMQIWNAQGRVNWLSIPNSSLLAITGISNLRTLQNTRQSLENRGLIVYEKGKRNVTAPRYSITHNESPLVENIGIFEKKTTTSNEKVSDTNTSEVTSRIESSKENFNATSKDTSNTPSNEPSKDTSTYTEKSKSKRREENNTHTNAPDASEQFSEYLKIFSDFTKGVKNQPRSNAQIAFVDLHELQKEQAIFGARNYVEWYKKTGRDIYHSVNAARFLEDLIFTDYQEVPEVKESAAKSNYSTAPLQPKSGKKLPDWSDEAKLIKAGIDTTGMSQNEMYHLVREKGLANG